MAKSTRNSGNPWSAQDINKLKELAGGNTPTRVIGLKLGRTENAIYSEAAKLGISLKPVNKPPYNRQKSK